MIKTGQEPRSGNEWYLIKSWMVGRPGNKAITTHSALHFTKSMQQEVASFPDSVEEPENEGITQ